MTGQKPKPQYFAGTVQQPRRKSTQKARRKPAAASTRPVRHRQAKIIPSIETDDVPVDSESDFGDPAIAQQPSSNEAPDHDKVDLPRAVRESTSVLDSFNNGGLRDVRALLAEILVSSDGSEYHPSDKEETVSDADDVGHSRKRSKTNNGPVHIHINTTSTEASLDSSERCSHRTGGNEPIVPPPGSHGSLRGEHVDVEGQRRTKRLRDGTEPQPHHSSSASIENSATDRQNPGEGSSRSAGDQVEPPVQYLHTIARVPLSVGPASSKISQVNLVQRSKAASVTKGHQLPTRRLLSPGVAIRTRNEAIVPSPEFQSHVVSFSRGLIAPAIVMGKFNLVDCRNERNGVNGGSSKGKEPACNASQKCKPCFKFRRNCDQGKPACGHCTRGNVPCVPRQSQAKVNHPVASRPAVTRPVVHQPGIIPPAVPEFSGSQMWEKCQRCAALGNQCSFDDNENDCQNCKKRGWKCVPQTGPKPKKKYAYRGRFQDPNTKCIACAKARSHCDGAQPKCERCARWGYTCYPPGSEPRKVIPKDEKCKRCRQLKLACSDTLPCPRCVKEGIECGMTAKEEDKELRFLGER